MMRLWYYGLGALACSLMLFVAPAHAFERTHTCYSATDGRTPVCQKRQKPVPIRWKTGCTTWRTHADFPDEFLTPVKNSFQTWNRVSGSYFQTYYAGSTDQFGAAYDCQSGESGNENVVSYLEDWPESLAGSDVVALTSVVYTTDTGEILDADIRMNGQHFHWKVVTSVSRDLTIVDIQNVMTHEVGHFLGLEHTTEATYQGNSAARHATMYANTYPNEIKRRVLDDDDIAGVRAIYPIADAPSRACEPPEVIDHVDIPAGFDPQRFACKAKKKGCNAAAASSVPLASVFYFVLLVAFLRRYTSRAHREKGFERTAE